MHGKLFIRLSQLKTLIENYPYPAPLSLYIKEYFTAHKNLGSKDRKEIKAWLYAFFKSDFLNEGLSLETELLHVLKNDASAILQSLKLQCQYETTAQAKVTFPLSGYISPMVKTTIDELKEEKLVWLRFLQQDCMIEEESIVLEADGLFGLKPSTAIAIPDTSYQIQDWASYMAAKKCAALIKGSMVWDICCGAGGKALTILDHTVDLQYYASDIRPQIVEALKGRVRDRKVITGVVNLNNPLPHLNFGGNNVTQGSFDCIIADVPCSGSGTWGRNPQHLRSFTETHLERFVQLQRTIISNALPFLKPEGRIFYITCSVYNNENEEQLAYFNNEHNLIVEEKCYLNQKGSDTLFWAVLKRATNT